MSTQQEMHIDDLEYEIEKLKDRLVNQSESFKIQHAQILALNEKFHDLWMRETKAPISECLSWVFVDGIGEMDIEEFINDGKSLGLHDQEVIEDALAKYRSTEDIIPPNFTIITKVLAWFDNYASNIGKDTPEVPELIPGLMESLDKLTIRGES
jgi:hypothetical protein